MGQPDSNAMSDDRPDNPYAVSRPRESFQENYYERVRSRSARMIPAENFMATLAANIDNSELSDAAFRQLVRNTMPIVQR